MYPTYNNKEWLYKRLPLACGVGMPRPYTRVSREAFVLSELVVFAVSGGGGVATLALPVAVAVA